MKKVLLLTCIATIALACGNNSAGPAHNPDESHAGHHDTTLGAAGKKEENPITGTMDEMMRAMHGTTPTGNNDIDFAVMMIAHHKGAVEMSRVEVDKGTNAELKAFAKKLIEDQGAEIDVMQGVIGKSEKVTSPDAKAFQAALHGSMMAMMKDTTKVYNNIDLDFAAQMIPHHQSAVDMAKAYLDAGGEGRLKTFCEGIIHSQTAEIAWLKDWLAKNGNERE